ncbi:MAG: hypothetical protein IJU51_06960 [Clostridia bacterium]|nr:hypothetical protein [Clostridia bacterium]
MNIYANGFYAAIKKDKSEYVLTLLQETPKFDKSGKVIESITEPVGTFTLSQECAKALAQDLCAAYLQPISSTEN